MRALSLLPCRFWGGPRETDAASFDLAARPRRGRDHDRRHADGYPDSIDDNPLLLRARAAGFEVTPFVQKRRYDLLEGVRVLRQLVARYAAGRGLRDGLQGRRARRVARGHAVRGHAPGLDGAGREGAPVRVARPQDAAAARLRDRRLQHPARGGDRGRALRRSECSGCRTRSTRTSFHRPAARGSLPRDRRRPGRPLVGAVGRFEPRERPPRADRRVRPVAESSAGSPPRRSQGDGPEEASLRRQVEALGLSGHVTFMGLRAERQHDHRRAGRDGAAVLQRGNAERPARAFAYRHARGGDSSGRRSRHGVGWALGLARAGRATPRRSLLRFRRRSKTGPRRNDGSLGLAAFLRKSFTVEKQAAAWLQAVNAAIGAKPTPRAEVHGLY